MSEEDKLCMLHIFQCRRNIKTEAFDTRPVIKNVTTIDPSKNYLLFPECKECKLGKRITVLKSREPPFTTYEIRGCTLRNQGIKT